MNRAVPSAVDCDSPSSSLKHPSRNAQNQIYCPADSALVGTVAEATAADAELAIRAARTAFDSGEWPNTPARQRADLLRGVADRLAAERDEVARLESLDTGKRFYESQLDMDDICC